MQQPIRLELPFAIDRTTVNAYLFREPEPVLIDTGDSSPEVWEALVDGAGRAWPAPGRSAQGNHLAYSH